MLHQPVLCREVNELILPPTSEPLICVDVTAGYGGHAGAIYQQLPPGSTMILMDRDPAAIAHLHSQLNHWQHTWRQHCSGEPPDVYLRQHPFSHLSQVLGELGLTKVHSIFADLGVSSPQLDQGHRGFAIQHSGPLDMRMNPNDPLTAADLIARTPESELADIIYNYGEEPKARHIARAIVRRRQSQPITTTTQLAELICAAMHRRGPAKRHPATRTFQALRIYINREIQELTSLLESFPNHLKPGGHCGIISFHSLEDRPIKQHMKALAYPHLAQHDDPLGAYFSPPLAPSPPAPTPAGELIKPFPIKPSTQEITQNPRARSAKLRICKWLD